MIMMGFLNLLTVTMLTVCSLLDLAASHPVEGQATKPAAFFLAGDSTTATQSPGGGGE